MKKSGGPAGDLARTLGGVVSDPEILERVPETEIPAMLVALASVQTVLAARLTGNAMVANDTESEKILGVEEAAKVLGVSASYLYRHKDTIPHTRIGRRLLFPATKLQRFIERRTRA